jgi:type VI secretion system protein ImpJ
MTSSQRVVWSDGLFLRPSHFQQMERWVERLVDTRVAVGPACRWGFTHLRLDTAAAAGGLLGLAAARGVMPDGTPFSLPDDAPVPAPVEIPADAREVRIHLALPAVREGAVQVAFEGAAVPPQARWLARTRAVVDTVLPDAELTEMALGELQFRLVCGDEPAPGLCRMPVARVIERRAGGALTLDETWIAPSLDCRAVPSLQALLAEARHLVRHRADAIAARLSSAAARGAEVGELLTLLVANRHDAALGHLMACDPVPPDALFALLARAVGELATFDDRRGRRARSMPAWRHEDPREGLAALMDELRSLLSDVVDPHAVALPLQSRAAGLWTAALADPALPARADLVLVVRADLPAEALRRRFPAQVKIGPADRIRDLVRLHLPAIGLEPLPVAPSRLPYYAGFTYFRLDRQDPLWGQLATARVLALHVAGEFPGLRLELWAVRE